MTKLGEMRDLVGIYFRPNFSSPVASRDFVYNFKGFGGDEGDRTPDLNAASVALSQLSYVPSFVKCGVPSFVKCGVPKGSRTPVLAVKGRCPRPLDDGDKKLTCEATSSLYYLKKQACSIHDTLRILPKFTALKLAAL